MSISSQGYAGRGRNHHRLFAFPAAIIALLLFMPLVTLTYLASGNSDGVWSHLIENVLPHSITTTFLLMIGVGIGTAIIGVGTAWLTSMCHFPGRKLLQWLLVLPLAMPIYIVTYIYIELLDYTGPVQTFIRFVFGFTSQRDYWFFDFNSLPGAIFVMTMVLYPYVYLTTRLVFLMQGANILEAARSLGAGPMRMFRRIALPMARPAIVVGVTVALMESLNDIGAVEILGVQTLTFSIYDTWLNRGSLAGAAQIACLTLAIIVLLITIERFARRNQRFASTRHQKQPSQFRLTGASAVFATLACLLPVLFGFIIPFAALVNSSSRRIEQLFDEALLQASLNSIFVAGFTALITVIAAFTLVYAARIFPKNSMRLAGRMASLGYAVPGTVVAIGILVPLAYFDNWLDGLMRTNFDISTGLLISGSAAIIIYACTVRFLALAHGSLESGLGKISPHLDMAARSLGRTAGQTLRQIHLPLMAKAMATAALLVFVDTMKELSATILLRPFDFNTLATLVYEQASLAIFEDASIAALIIVLIGMVPVMLLMRMSDTNTHTQR